MLRCASLPSGCPKDMSHQRSRLLLQCLSPRSQKREQLHTRCTLVPPTGETLMPQVSQALPCLYLSDLWTATHVTTLTSLGITHRLSIQIAPLEPPPKDVALKTRCIPLQDKCGARLWMYMDTAIDWISAALSEGSTGLVHCTWGKSRFIMYLPYHRHVRISCLAHESILYRLHHTHYPIA